MATTLDWTKLRQHKGSVPEAFEELCCLLAEHCSDEAERLRSGWQFFRKGTPDAGCECLWTTPEGDEFGWQAKWFIGPIIDSRWQEIDKSVRAAMEKHPRLIEYTICIPQDRADPRLTNAESFKDKWDQHEAKWQDWATSTKREIRFNYWGTHEFFDRLMQPRHVGRGNYFFDANLFTPSCFLQHVQSQLKNAGPRYTPELSIELEVGRFVEALSRTPQWRSKWGAAIDKFVEAADRLTQCLSGKRLAPNRRRIKVIVRKIAKDGSFFRTLADKLIAPAQLASTIRKLAPILATLELHNGEQNQTASQSAKRPPYGYELDDLRRASAELRNLFSDPSAVSKKVS